MTLWKNSAILVLPAILLQGCNTPSPKLVGAQHAASQINGTEYVAYFNHTDAEVIRTSPIVDRSIAQSDIMKKLLEQVSGCQVNDSEYVDKTILRAQLTCEETGSD